MSSTGKFVLGWLVKEHGYSYPCFLKMLTASQVRSPLSSKHAFSLVEVVMAIGIVSFALISVLGLIPVGLKSVKNATEQAAAANALNALADSLRGATSTNLVDYSCSFAGTSITFNATPANPAGTSSTYSWLDLNLAGATDSSDRRLSVRVVIAPRTSVSDPIRAVISAAWPAQANPVWNAAAQTWEKADGSITSGIQFLPRP